MSKKRFDHFMSFWQQMMNPRTVKSTPARRVTKAKARLRLALAAR